MTGDPQKKYIITEELLNGLIWSNFLEQRTKIGDIVRSHPYTHGGIMLDEVNIGFFYQESIPYPNGEYKFRMKIIKGDFEIATQERRTYGEAFTDLFNLGIKENRFFRECNDEQDKQFARSVMKDIEKLKKEETGA